MARSPWPRRKRSTKPDTGAGAPTDATHPTDPLGTGPDPEIEAGTEAGSRRRTTPRKSAMDILARREHSVAELREKLRARDFADDEIEATLIALSDEGLLSEERFLASFVGSYTRRGHGPVWIRGELERRGVTGEQISEALANADTDWIAQAAAVRAKRFGAGPPADYKDQARQARFLQYRGFTAEQVRAALQRAGDDRGD
jgi:regulatory protein